MKPTNAIVFPFDNFGSPGTGAGAHLLGDALNEILDDNEAETAPTRADCYKGFIEIHEVEFATPRQVADWRKQGRALAKQALADSGLVLWLAGNHLGVLPLLEELPRGTLVVQFDAHLDVYALHDTTKELSHGNYLSHATRLPAIVHVGHRDLFLKAEELAKTFTAVHSAADLAIDPAAAIQDLRTRAATAKAVWIDLDCDALDPAYFPAVQAPLPFGLAPPQLLQLIEAVWSDQVIGVSISEFDPGRDVRDTSLNLLGWLVEFLLLKRYEAAHIRGAR